MNETSKLLVVDSNEAHRRSIVQRLEALGYSVYQVATGASAVDVACQNQPDLALIDVSMPDMDASELVRRLVTDETLNTIGVIMLVPMLQTPDQAQRLETCMANGASDYLIEPVSSALLRVQVEEYVASRRRRLEQRELLRREKLLNDVAIARRFQVDFLPKALPEAKGWELAAVLHPAREVAGDFYDAFTLSQGRRIGLVVADVCDKGVGAALFMALIRSLTRAFAQQNRNMDLSDLLTFDDKHEDADPFEDFGKRRALMSVGVNALKSTVTMTNNYIIDNHIDLNMFATMFFGVLDPLTGGLDYINGGHNPPYIVSSTGTIKAVLKPTGTAVGMVPQADFAVGHADIAPGDFLVAFTDGVPDARDRRGKSFGDKRLRELLSRPPATAAALVEEVDRVVREHIADAVQYDDITMLFVRRSAADGK